MSVSDDRLDEILSIDEALGRLAQFDPRRCRVVELRFFGGMTEGEVVGPPCWESSPNQRLMAYTVPDQPLDRRRATA